MKNIIKRSLALLLCMVLIVSGLQIQQIEAEETASPGLISKNRQIYASSENGSGEQPINANDGNLDSKWQAAQGLANQWITIDLGSSADISQIVINWNGSGDFAKDYEILVSEDEIEWTSLYRNRNGKGGVETKKYRVDGTVDFTYYKETINVQGKGRYVKVYARKSTSSYGIAIRELDIYGVGGIGEPERNLENLALNKPTIASSETESYSQLREAKYATDGEYDYFWLSQPEVEGEPANEEWLQVDLGAQYTIGKIELQWGDRYGRIFEIQTSLDGVNWEPIYRDNKGAGEDISFNCYVDARYVKMQGIATRDNGYSIRELMVYEYQEGDSKVNPTLPELIEKEVIQVGKGSYLIDETLPQPREPLYVTSNVKGAIPSSDWYTSLVYKRYSDSIISLPLVCNYTSAGLNMYNSDKVYTTSNSGSMGAEFKYKDLIVGTSAIKDTPAAKLDGFGDWSVNVCFSDDDTPKMMSTIIKGSPFVYNTFADPSSAQITIPNLIEIYDDEGNEILLEEGDKLVTDHIGITVSNKSKSPEAGEDGDIYHYYGIFAPKNSTFIRTQGKLIIQLGSGENYLSVGVMKNEKSLSYMYEFAYAFVKDTEVTYKYDEKTGNITTTYENIFDLKRENEGFRDETLMCLFPHQWKNYTGTLTGRTFTSIRGTLKILEGKGFSYSLKFNGIVPAFTEPTESESYDKELLESYIDVYTKSGAITSYWTADPYWQGKKLHTLATVSQIAQELGYYDLRDKCISNLKKILSNWLTYSGEDDAPFNMFYHTSWGSMSGDGGDSGMALNLSDHHFLWGYFIYSAAIVASYDSQFVEDYGEMVEMLIRDCMNPDKNDEMFPYMRNFDPYEGHSWAGGYGDNNSGNNQESASEATFAWSGLYLWGLATGNDEYRDAGIWGYTTEAEAIQQYWFNVDDDNWDDDYIHGDIGILWGLAYTYGTYFSGNPCCLYGIHMLPVTPSICYMGWDREAAAKIWKDYVNDQQYYQDNLAEGNSDPEGWHHIIWPFMSLSDPEGAVELWLEEEASGDSDIQTDEKLTSYWFIQNMCAKGTPNTSVWSNNYTSYQVYEKNGKFTAVVWNPFDYEIKVEFSDDSGVIGSTRVAPHDTVSVDPYKVTDNAEIDIPDVKDVDTVHTIPGTIQAEAYYTNYSCSTVTDGTVGEKVGYIDGGDYLVYDVDIKETAEYVIEYRIKASANGDTGQIKVQSDLDNTVFIADTVLNNVSQWNTVEDKVTLQAGRQQLKLLFVVGDFDFDYIRIYKVGDKPIDSGSDGVSVTADLSESPLISSGKKATVSSANAASRGADTLTDGSYSTRWESVHKIDPQWAIIDLDSSQKIGGVKMYWEGAAAKAYSIDISEDGENWKSIFKMTNGTGGSGYGDENRASGLESIKFDSVYTARYVRMYGTERKTGYGYSMYEFQVYGPGPGQKEALDATKVSATSKDDTVSLSWNEVDGASEYHIYRATSLTESKIKIGSTDKLEYTDIDLANGDYYYWVMAKPSDTENYNSSPLSEDIDVVTINYIVEVSKIHLNNTSVTIEVGEQLTLVAEIEPLKATDKTVKWNSSNRDIVTVRNGIIRGASVGIATITVTSSNGLTATCEVTVVPKEGTTEETTTVKPTEKPTEEITTKVDETTTSTKVKKPKKVKKLSLKALSGRRVKVKWKANKKSDKVTGYQIVYSTSKKFKKKKTKNISAKKFKKLKKSYTLKKLKVGKKYFVKVRAYKKVNGIKVYGKYSAKKAIKIKK